MIRMTSLHLICAMAFGLWNTPAWADSLCADKALQATADAQLKKAEELERAGRPREAYAAAAKADSDCVSDTKRHDALQQRTAKAIGVEDEKKSHLQDAFEWYVRAQAVADAGRMQRKLVDTKPDDINTVSHAIDYFSQQNDKAQEQAMRGHALKQVEKALAEEEKRFASFTKDSLHELQLAKNWAYYAKAGEDRIRARAAQRGDTLAAEEGRKFLHLAISYYEQADRPDGVKTIREKARLLAKRHEAKGEGEIAAEFYAMAGENKQAETVQKQTEQRQAQAEEGRKKTFKKEQADLEKALGF
ncbi:MAG: hypothetical protein JSR64_14435 [Nitrospira sp.]|nr:hypothetical protein [Nitrospira sp.]MBS0175234.1 hypothetical protein [Nitrospira sp.]MBX3339005.1 hypothetical protein [Nitrospira sp.]MCW5780271.1 hypothetical protein [Nitrospira sp.]HNN40970.1 hypothetical protein [Nitrospira sp.]